jgi:hypothetical protein
VNNLNVSTGATDGIINQQRAGALRHVFEIPDHVEKVFRLRITTRAKHADQALGRRAGRSPSFSKPTVAERPPLVPRIGCLLSKERCDADGVGL